MKQRLKRYINLSAGVFLFALGIVISIQANIGYAPWEVFHVGLSLTTGLSIGVASIIAGIVVVIIVTLSGEKFGLGTVFSIVVTGLFIDMIMYIGLIPISSDLITGIIMLIIGLFIISIGSYLYMKSAFGAGPRDNLMVVLNRKTKMPIGVCRSLVELAVTIAGWLLGGMVGIGTIISVVVIGFFIQIIFAVFRFDAAKVEHETIRQTFRRRQK
jgi:uncharacterized membrane protein YczE